MNKLLKCSLTLFFFTKELCFAACPNPSTQPITKVDIHNTTQFTWTLNSAANWKKEATLPFLPTIKKFQTYTSSKTNTDQIFLLKKQQQIFDQIGSNSDHEKFQALIDGHIASITKSSCLDHLLYARQLEKTGYTATEFQAYIFEKGDQIKIIGAWRNAYDESLSAPQISMSNNAISKLLNEGWTFLYNLHNHPFFFDNPYDIAGTILGSDPDITNNLLQMKVNSLQFSRITNGFHSATYNRKDLEYLSNLITQ